MTVTSFIKKINTIYFDPCNCNYKSALIKVHVFVFVTIQFVFFKSSKPFVELYCSIEFATAEKHSHNKGNELSHHVTN